MASGHPTDTTATSTHPELDKLHAARDAASDEIGQFIEWLGEQGYVIARWERPMVRLDPWHFVCNQATPNKPGTTRPCHRSLSRGHSALCGAVPEHYTVLGREFIGEWYAEVSLATPSPAAVCERCERLYKEGEWPEKPSDNEQLFGVHKPIERWLADYFGIDLAKVEQERAAILESLGS